MVFWVKNNASVLPRRTCSKTRAVFKLRGVLARELELPYVEVGLVTKFIIDTFVQMVISLMWKDFPLQQTKHRR